jgi:hypothetical protein
MSPNTLNQRREEQKQEGAPPLKRSKTTKEGSSGETSSFPKNDETPSVLIARQDNGYPSPRFQESSAANLSHYVQNAGIVSDLRENGQDGNRNRPGYDAIGSSY